jgi:hypothetical protein
MFSGEFPVQMPWFKVLWYQFSVFYFEQDRQRALDSNTYEMPKHQQKLMPICIGIKRHLAVLFKLKHTELVPEDLKPWHLHRKFVKTSIN